MSHARLFLADILTALRKDLGTYDLSTVSSTPRVVIADGGAPPVGPPYVLISAPSVKSSYDSALTEYHIEGSCDWWAWVAAATESTEARAFAGLDFADEIVTAIENAHADPTYTTLYVTTRVIVGWDQVFADGPDLPPGCAVVHGTIEYATDVSRGG